MPRKQTTERQALFPGHCDLCIRFQWSGAAFDGHVYPLMRLSELLVPQIVQRGKTADEAMMAVDHQIVQRHQVQNAVAMNPRVYLQQNQGGKSLCVPHFSRGDDARTSVSSLTPRSGRIYCVNLRKPSHREHHKEQTPQSQTIFDKLVRLQRLAFEHPQAIRGCCR